MHLFLAIDLGATNTRLGMVSENGDIKKQIVLKTPNEGTSAAVIPSFLIKSVKNFLSHEEFVTTEGIGISTAGPVDTTHGILINPPNIPFHDIPLVGPLQDSFNLPVYLANDCHCGVIGEVLFGSAQGSDNVVYITMSTGIGGGVILDGNLLIGRGGNAAEIGHFTVDTTYNLKCGCGHFGHWEGYASGRYIPQFFQAWCKCNSYTQGESTIAESKEIFRWVHRGDPQMSRFIDELGQINSRGISDVIVAYDPETIILDGSVVINNKVHIVPPMVKKIDRFLPLPNIVVSHLHGLAPLLGAAIIAHGYETPFGSLKKS